MVQWFHLYEMHDGILSLVLNTFATVFPCMEIWDCDQGDIALIGSDRPWPAGPDHYRRALARPEASQDLARIGIGSVPALLARQLASQRTAFAVAQTDAVQSDLFPVLEYRAPQAFFLGVTSKILTRFDERTWQRELAPAWKQETLAALSPVELQPVFEVYRTMNAELDEWLKWHWRAGSNTNQAPAPAVPPTWRCLFGPSSRPLSSTPPPPDPSDPAGMLARLDWLFQGDSPGQREAVDLVETLLQTTNSASAWPAAHYAARAAKACLVGNDPHRAAHLLSLGLQAAPQDPQLLFLARIAEREQSGPWQFSSRQDNGMANP